MAELNDDKPAASVEVSVGDQGVPVIAIRGELDIASVEPVRTALDAAVEDDSGAVIVDLSALTFMDSSGIALLLQLAGRVGSVSLRNVSPMVRRIIELTGLSETFGLPS